MMNDRYLFRAKRIDNGEWVQGYYTYYPYGFTSVDKVEHAIRDTVTSEDCNKLYFVDPSTICQCTGIKDKNGKLIWENDILKYQWDGEERIDVIKYQPPIFTYSDSFRWSLNEDKVIGNIFDNPELLEQEG